MTTAAAWAAVSGQAATAQLRTLIITGGEPASQATPLAEVAKQAKSSGWRVELETSGVARLQPLAEFCDLITVSPKLSNSGLPIGARIVPEVLTELAAYPNTVFKFVVEDPHDFVEVDELVAQFGLGPVWVMPQARDREQLTRGLIHLTPLAVSRGYRVSTRLQIEIWGGERGR